MNDKIDIEKVLFPNANELEINNGDVKSTIVDAELDPLTCSFNNDSCVTIDTSNLTYITLSVTNLKMLISLIKRSDKYFDSEDFLNLPD